MVSKKTLFLTVAIAVVLAIPTVAWAINGPLAADPQIPDQQAPVTPDQQAPSDGPVDRSYGGMGGMHDYMWGNPDGTLPEDLPDDFASWMGGMHDYMWGNPDGTLPEGLPDDFPTWMGQDQMRDWWWGNTNGAVPQLSPDGQGWVPSQYRVPAVTQDGTPVVPAGWNGGGCGMWGNR